MASQVKMARWKSRLLIIWYFEGKTTWTCKWDSMNAKVSLANVNRCALAKGNTQQQEIITSRKWDHPSWQVHEINKFTKKIQSALQWVN